MGRGRSLATAFTLALSHWRFHTGAFTLALSHWQVPPLTDRDRMRRPVIPPAEELHLQGHGGGMPGALVVAALIPLLPRGVTAVCMPFQGAWLARTALRRT
eukprot:3941679-Prymnesium_polylepis.1